MFNSFLNDALKVINERNSSNEAVCDALLPLKSIQSPNSFEPVVVPVTKSSISCKVAGVDSGFATKKLSFIELVLVKTCGAIFDYKDGKLIKSNYYPPPFSFPKPIILKAGLESDEQLQSVSLIRLKEEVNCSIEIIEKFRPDFLFIDGSIIPQYQDKPKAGSELNEDYNSIIHLFQKLYKTAQENNCVLIACVEDSRGTRFRQILSEEILPKSPIGSKTPTTLISSSFDTSLLDYYLLPRERTFVFPYTKNPTSHAILKDYEKDWQESVFVFYIKSTDFDNPLRVEFLCKNHLDKKELKKLSDNIASIVFTLSSLHKEYSFPSILIEADLRAGLSEREINLVYERLLDKMNPKMSLRRNNRPFW